MRNVILSLVVVSVMVAGALGGTFAGFVDTESSQGNLIQAGISDLLVNGKNDPIGAKINFTHVVPCKSTDFWVDVFNWGVCQGGNLYMTYANVTSVEDGAKLHLGKLYVYDEVSSVGGDIPDGYRVKVGNEPQGAGVWSSEPEKIAEVGNGTVAGIWIPDDHPCLKGEDYASGISDNLNVTTEVPLVGASGNELGNPDLDGNGTVEASEYAAWTANGNRWHVVPSLTGILSTIKDNKDLLGFLKTQHMSFIHISVHLKQPACSGWPDAQTKYWPSNALQGDKATWDMTWELNTDPD
jgi:hypothetical protein